MGVCAPEPADPAGVAAPSVERAPASEVDGGGIVLGAGGAATVFSRVAGGEEWGLACSRLRENSAVSFWEQACNGVSQLAKWPPGTAAMSPESITKSGWALSGGEGRAGWRAHTSMQEATAKKTAEPTPCDQNERRVTKGDPPI